MQLDRTRIVTRERDYPDLLDLALRVWREFAGPLLVAFAAGVAPWIVFNAWLLAGFTEGEYEAGFPFAHMFWMTLLVLYEVPLATAPAVIFLGHAVFASRPQAGRVAGTLARSAWQMIFYQVLFRWWYWRWPFLTEVILLEQNPFRSKDARQLTTRQRGASLHRGYGADLLARSLCGLCLGSLMLASIWLSLWLAFYLLFGRWEWGDPVYTWLYPLSLWMVCALFAVVRFLSYLDLRIRREGWEVELLMRAEQAGLERKLL